MNLPNRFIVINFKTYSNTAGNRGINLAKKLDYKNVIICAGFLELSNIAKNVKCNVFSQHLDSILPEKNTGFISAYHVKKNKGSGTLLNHSEHKLKIDLLKESIKQCKKNKLKIIVCASNLKVIKQIAKLKPDYIAYEASELIGGKKSITDSHPLIIKRAIVEVNKISKRIGVLCGAGIHTARDVKSAINSGCCGVLVASGIVCAKNPKQVLSSLLKAL